MKKLIVVIGTRPELIKTAPVIRQFDKLGLRNSLIVVNTAQHKEVLDPFWNIFEINYDYKLDFMISGQSLSELTARAINQFQKFLDELSDDHIVPEGILAQGDTTTVMIASMMSFYNKIKFFHLEAGLRSFDLANPFPEEYNRIITGLTAFMHFAPTHLAVQNLLNEGVKNENILLTGNTVVDALKFITNTKQFNNYDQINKMIPGFQSEEKIVLFTCHRRENFGRNLLNIIKALKSLANKYSEYRFIWPVHPNPNISKALEETKLDKIKNVLLIPPIGYIQLLQILSRCRVAITDSGGIQEEAPSFHIPVIVLREKTERPEGVDLGIAHLVGADIDKIYNSFAEITTSSIKIDLQPYGDGFAAERIVESLVKNVF